MKNTALKAVDVTVSANISPILKDEWQFKNNTRSISVNHQISFKPNTFSSKEVFQTAQNLPEKIDLTVDDPLDKGQVQAKLVETIHTSFQNFEELNRVFTKNRVNTSAYKLLKDLSELDSAKDVLNKSTSLYFDADSSADIKLAPMVAAEFLVKEVSQGKYSLCFLSGTTLFREHFPDNEEPYQEEIRLLDKRSNRNSAHKIFIDKVIKYKDVSSEPQKVRHARLVIAIAQQLDFCVRSITSVFTNVAGEYHEYYFSAQSFLKPFNQIIADYEDSIEEDIQNYFEDLSECTELADNKRLSMLKKYTPESYIKGLKQEAEIMFTRIVGEHLKCRANVEGTEEYLREPDGQVAAPDMKALEALEKLDELRASNKLVKLLLNEFADNDSLAFPFMDEDESIYVVIGSLNTEVFHKDEYLLLTL